MPTQLLLSRRRAEQMATLRKRLFRNPNPIPCAPLVLHTKYPASACMLCMNPHVSVFGFLAPPHLAYNAHVLPACSRLPPSFQVMIPRAPADFQDDEHERHI